MRIEGTWVPMKVIPVSVLLCLLKNFLICFICLSPVNAYGPKSHTNTLTRHHA